MGWVEHAILLLPPLLHSWTWAIETRGKYIDRDPSNSIKDHFFPISETSRFQSRFGSQDEPRKEFLPIPLQEKPRLQTYNLQAPISAKSAMTRTSPKNAIRSCASMWRFFRGRIGPTILSREERKRGEVHPFFLSEGLPILKSDAVFCNRAQSRDYFSLCSWNLVKETSAIERELWSIHFLFFLSLSLFDPL